MVEISRVDSSRWRRCIAAALGLLWLTNGVLPGLHQHESGGVGDAHLHEAGTTAAQHIETPEPTHPDVCGLCVTGSSLDGLERPARTFLTGALVAERPQTVPDTKAAVSHRRYGATRAPPNV